MILGIGAEARMFLFACFTGISILAVYGILVWFRKLVRHSAAAVGVEDLLFWLTAGAFIFRKIYETTYGEIRLFFLLGLLCGAGMGAFLYGRAAEICVKIKKSLEKNRKSG